MIDNRSIALDACRGIAVITVIAYHLSSFGMLPQSSLFVAWLACGMFGVDFFYVLSGFFITQAILRPRSWKPDVFLRARINRIYPAFVFSLLLIVALKIYIGHAFDLTMIIGILLHLTMLHNLFPGVGDSLNGVYWTLGVEFPYYILMLALASFLRSSNRGFWTLCLGMLVLCLVWRQSAFLFLPPGGLARFFAATQLPGALDAFALGGMAAMLHLNSALRERLIQARWLLLAIGLTGVAFCLRYFMAHSGNYWEDWMSVVVWRSIFALGCAIVTLACAKMQNNQLLHYSGLPWLGKISFSLYLYHVLVLNFVNRYYGDRVWEFRLPVSVAIMLAVSWLSWRFVESRFHKTASIRASAGIGKDAARSTALRTAGGTL
ncbi:acyltransferase [soil metagenome]